MPVGCALRRMFKGDLVMSEDMMFDGRPVKAVHITATVEMVSFVFADYPGDVITTEHQGEIPDTKTPLRERISHEIQDALEYRSHHLNDSGDGDGLIAPYETPVVMAVKVVDMPSVTGVDVESIAEGMSGGF